MIVERLILIILQFMAAAVVLFLSIAGWRKRNTAGRAAVHLSICMAAVAIYCFGYGMEIASNTLPDVMFWVRFEHWGIQMVAPTWLLFSLAITGRERYVTPKNVLAIFFLPAVFLVISQTLGTLNLGHPNPHLNTSGIFPTFDYDRGVFIYISLVFTSLCMAASTYLFTMMLIRSAPAFRVQAFMFWIGSMIPWGVVFLYNMGLTPYNIDPIPLTLSLCGLLYLLGFYKFRMLDIIPLARDMILEGMDDGVLVMDKSDRIIDVNPRGKVMLPTVSNESVGRQAAEVLAQYPILLKLLKKSPNEAVEFKVTDEGSTYHYRAVLTLLQNRRKRVMGRIITIYDNSHVKQLLEQLEDLATHDSLTGVYNIRHFYELANKELYRVRRYGEAVSLIMFDLDQFKRVNDTYGHAAGDAVLKAVAGICTSLLRKSDIICRYGGDEFIILLPETDPSIAAILAQRLRTALEEARIQYKDHFLDIQASFGVAGVVAHGRASLDELLFSVDHTMYDAKKAGRNQVCISTL